MVSDTICNTKKENKKKWCSEILHSKNYPATAHYSVINCDNGVSSGVYTSLNVGLLSGDDKEKVITNRKRLQDSLALKQLIFAQQVHKSDIAIIKSPKDFPKSIGENIFFKNGCDAMITNCNNIGLAIQHADCQAIMLFDPQYMVIAAIHCGWRGNVQNIIAKTISVMKKIFGTNSQNLLAFISPSLGVCCAEFINYTKELPSEFYHYRNGDNHFDFKGISCSQLKDCGIIQENITVDMTCTCCSPHFFSYRRAQKVSNGNTGRNCTVIFMP